MEIREATKQDIEHFARGEKSPTMRAWSIYDGDELMGLAGFAFVYHRWYAFFEMKESLRRHKTFLVRSGKLFMRMAREQGIRFLYCDIDPTEETAFKWVTSLGFEFDERSGKHYRWRNGEI